MAEITLYGIPNCDTVKKARRWVDQQGLDYRFHNFKKDGITLEMLSRWQQSIGLQALVNRRGTTWRKLDAEQKALVDSDTPQALELIAKEPSLIKRPVLEFGQHNSVGFDEQQWFSLFKL